METVQTLSRCGAVDLLILFPDAVDALRNEQLYFMQSESNLDRVFGSGSNWRDRITQVANASGQNRRELYTEIYLGQLKKLAGYSYFDKVSIRGPAGPLYRLVFATKHELGLKFWRESVKKDLTGQTSLFD
jgi:three-Cys-motif partner protein